MSLKIHLGFVVSRGGDGLADIAAVLREFGPQVLALASEGIATKCAVLCAEVIDRSRRGVVCSALGPRVYDGSTSVGTWAYLQAVDRHNAIYQNRERDPDFDWECEVGIWDCGGRALVNLSTEIPEHPERFAALPGVGRYPFWDNTDAPSDVPPEEWRARGEAWRSTSKWSGLSWSAIGRYGLPIPSLEGMLARVPSPEDRAKRLATCEAMAAYVEREVAEGRLDAAPYALVTRVKAALAWLNTDEGATDVAQRRLEIELHVQPIVLDDLKASWPLVRP